jgi:hypothetical protein
MTMKSRLLATALAISLATPAAAVTISTISLYDVASYKVIGPAEFTENFVIHSSGGTLFPEPVIVGDIASYEYFVDVTRFSPAFTFGSGHIVTSDCFRSDGDCIGEGGFREITAHVGDTLVFKAWWFGFFGFSESNHPFVQLTLTIPDGVTLAQTPLPASWLLFASALGLGGWFGWRRRAHV